MRLSLTSIRVLAAALAVAATSWPSAARAGCGCAKPAPVAASVRPYVTYAGTPVTLFSANFTVGNAYTVTFTSGISGQSASVAATVVSLRDLADGLYKPQLVVTLPTLPLGPTRITATRNGFTQPDVSIADNAFTVAPTPIAVPYTYGIWHYPNFQAAVDRSGVMYFSLDLSGVTSPLVFDAYLAGYPLRYAAKDVVFRNVQGFLMQLLLSGTQPVPGMFVLPAGSPTSNSEVLRYSRHEFSTYFLQHLERQPHALDATDNNWHIDGTRHVDHDHLILAIAGKLNGGVLPAPGATPACDMVVKAYSLFYPGLTGTGSVLMSGGATTDSLDSNTMQFGSNGDVFTLGTLTMKDTSKVMGDASAKAFTVATTAKINGNRNLVTTSPTFMSVTVPPGLPSLGSISISTATTRTIYGPGSFLVSSIALSKGGRLFIDNSAGPVTFYVTGAVTVSGGTIETADPKPEKFAMYLSSSRSVSISSTTSFYGVVYAPLSTVALSSTGSFTGAFFGKSLTMGTGARVHYDETLLADF